MIWQWITCNSSAIQGLAAVAIVLLTLLTLIVLFGYARDTKRIARASIAQLENAQMPFVNVVQNDLPPHSGWQLRNQGFGPALNIKCSFVEGKYIPSITTGEIFMVQNEFPSIVAGRVEADIRYESLSGLEYHTLIKWEDAELKVQFKRPERRAKKKKKQR